MFEVLFKPTPGALFVVIAALGYVFYRAALPRPIPGIPYNEASVSRVLGDATDMMKHHQEHSTVTDWITMQGIKLNSPIIQLFTKPFCRPVVYVLDPRETQDVLLRRSRDFDRSVFFADFFSGTVPDHHIVQPTNDKFRRGRRLLADTMSNGFLHGVAAPSIHRHTLKLMELWRTKSSLAAGHAFWAADDINNFALDSIWDTALGSQLDSLGQEMKLLQKTPEIDLPKSADEAVSFPTPNFAAGARSMKVITHALDTSATSPLPRQHHWVLRLAPSYRRANAQKEKLIQESLDDAKSRLLHNKNSDSSSTTAEFSGITCATDHMVRREAQAAEKEGRAPAYDSRQAKDELFGFLVGGHDTTATAIMWMVKLIADNPRVQNKLRAVLRAAFPGRTAVPAPEQMTKVSIPYLEAVIEESLRVGQPASIAVRQAVHDTQLLGYCIPKGVDVFFMANGPGYIAPNDVNETISESVRSASSRENKGRIPNWDPVDVALFKPERWLKTDDEGRESFDGLAGPVMQFGGGVRGCFGKKLAYLEMRILMIVLLWSFELLPAPGKLGSYKYFDSLTAKPKACYLVLK